MFHSRPFPCLKSMKLRETRKSFKDFGSKMAWRQSLAKIREHFSGPNQLHGFLLAGSQVGKKKESPLKGRFLGSFDSPFLQEDLHPPLFLSKSPRLRSHEFLSCLKRSKRKPLGPQFYLHFSFCQTAFLGKPC